MISQHSRLSSNLKNLLHFAFIVVAFIALAIMGGQYYDHASDPAYVAVFKGIFAQGPWRLSNNDGQWIGLHYLIHYLYKFSSTIDWYGGIIILLCALSAFLMLKIIGQAQKEGKFTVAIVALVLLLSFENLILLEFTRIASLLSFLGILLVVYHLKINTGTGVNRKIIIFGLVAFILGCLVRHQAGILSFILILPVTGIYLGAGDFSLRTLLKYFAVPLLFLGALLVFVSIRWDESWDKTPEYGGYMISLWDVDFPKGQLQLKSKEDSLIHQIVTGIQFTNDPQNINPGFFKKIGVPYTDKKLQSAATILSNKVNYKQKFKHVGVGYIMKHPGWSLLFLATMLIALFSWRQNRRFQAALIVLFLLYVALYFFIAVLLKMEERIFCPFVFSCTLVYAMLINGKSSKDFRGWSLASILLLSAFTLIELTFFYDRFAKRKNEADYIASILHILRARPEKNIFLDHISDQVYLSPLQKDPLDINKNYPTFDNYFFFLLPTYQQKMYEITGNNSSTGYLKFATEHPADCLFISDEKRLTEILGYFNHMYNLQLRYKVIVPDLRKFYTGNTDQLEPLGLFKIIN